MMVSEGNRRVRDEPYIPPTHIAAPTGYSFLLVIGNLSCNQALPITPLVNVSQFSESLDYLPGECMRGKFSD